MIRFAPQAVLVATLSVVVASAQAAPNLFEGQASISELSIEVIDLRPDDGVAAAFVSGKHTLTGSTSTTLEPFLAPSYGVVDAGYPLAGTSTQQGIKQLIGGPDFQFRVPDSQTGFGRTVGDYTVNVVAPLAEVLGPDLITNPQPGMGFDAGMSIKTQSWVLKAGTEVHISGVIDLSMRNDLTQLPPYFFDGSLWFFPYQYAKVDASLGFTVVGGNAVDVFVGASSAHAEFNTGVLELSQQIDESLSESFVLVARNLGTTDVVLNSSLDLKAQYLVATPIPEPSSVALVLAGLGFMGWRVRRRTVALS